MIDSNQAKKSPIAFISGLLGYVFVMHKDYCETLKGGYITWFGTPNG